VIAPGAPILDTTGWSSRHASIRSIDVVEPGQPAQVRLTAFKQRRTPTVQGRVVQVSADRLSDEPTGTAY
jgi:membrane fusion protein, epimerase transport system